MNSKEYVQSVYNQVEKRNQGQGLYGIRIGRGVPTGNRLYERIAERQTQ